jgi:uracil phosphoribosyltransferase
LLLGEPLRLLYRRSRNGGLGRFVHIAVSLDRMDWLMVYVQVLVVSILGSKEGVIRAAQESGGECIEIFIGAIDAELGGNGGGMIIPG